MDPASGQLHTSGRPIRLGGAILGAHRHICAFFKEDPFFAPPRELLRSEPQKSSRDESWSEPKS